MTQLHHRLEGPDDAPVVVLASSIGTTLDLWEPQVSALGEHFRVLRYDHRGHGRSPSPPAPYAIADLAGDVLELLDRLEIERASICGLSMGGMVGQWLGANHPERVDRLVLTSTSAYAGPPQKWHDRAATVRADGIEAIADGVLTIWLTEEFRAREPEAVARCRAMMVANDDHGYAGCAEAIAGFDLREGLGEITAPTLVVAGARDSAISPEQARALHEGIEGSELALLDDAAHLPNLEQPAAFNDRVLEHLSASARR